MAVGDFKSANRRYHRIFWPLIGAYMALCTGSVFFTTPGVTPPWVFAALAVAVSAPMLGVMWAMLRYFDETDEYTRARQYRAFAIGGALVLSALTVLSFLQLYGVIRSVTLFWFVPGFFLAYGIAYCTDLWRSCGEAN